MRYAALHSGRRVRGASAIAATLLIIAGAAASLSLSPGIADAMPFAPQVNPDTIALATGGGTMYTDPAQTSIGSFGINAKRPAGFASGQGGPAQGRINFDNHTNLPGRHINVPVTYMLAEIAQPQTGNQTGGH